MSREIQARLGNDPGNTEIENLQTGQAAVIALPSSISVAPHGYRKPLAQASAQPSTPSLREL